MSVINNELTCLALTGCVPLNARRRSASCVVEVSKTTQFTTQLNSTSSCYKRGLSGLQTKQLLPSYLKVVSCNISCVSRKFLRVVWQSHAIRRSSVDLQTPCGAESAFRTPLIRQPIRLRGSDPSKHRDISDGPDCH